MLANQVLHDRYLDHSEPLLPMSAYDGTEVHGVRDVAEDPAGGTICEVDDDDPEFFSVYLHADGHGVECVGDFSRQQDALAYAADLDAKYGWKPFQYPPGTEVSDLG